MLKKFLVNGCLFWQNLAVGWLYCIWAGYSKFSELSKCYFVNSASSIMSRVILTEKDRIYRNKTISGLPRAAIPRRNSKALPLYRQLAKEANWHRIRWGPSGLLCIWLSLTQLQSQDSLRLQPKVGFASTDFQTELLVILLIILLHSRFDSGPMTTRIYLF